MSLSRKIRDKSKEEKSKPVLVKPPQTPEIKPEHLSMFDEKMSDEILIDEDDSDEDKFRHILFVSDCKLIPSIRQQLDDYRNIKEYDRETFTNRSCFDLHDKKIEHIWVNLSDKHARYWISKNILKNKIYTSVCVYSGDKRSKWIEDVKKHCEIIIKARDLGKLKSLTFGEFQDNISSGLDIHPPVKKLLGCLFGSKNLSKKKNSNC